MFICLQKDNKQWCDVTELCCTYVLVVDQHRFGVFLLTNIEILEDLGAILYSIHTHKSKCFNQLGRYSLFATNMVCFSFYISKLSSCVIGFYLGLVCLVLYSPFEANPSFWFCPNELLFFCVSCNMVRVWLPFGKHCKWSGINKYVVSCTSVTLYQQWLRVMVMTLLLTVRCNLSVSIFIAVSLHPRSIS